MQLGSAASRLVPTGSVATLTTHIGGWGGQVRANIIQLRNSAVLGRMLLQYLGRAAGRSTPRGDCWND
jgi:hypothetical protein